MKRSILILIIALCLSGCFPENESGCPAYMRLSFHLEDDYEPGDFDSRIGNDVLLYIFQNGKLVFDHMVPYESISMGQEYRIRKNSDIDGNMDLVAWSVPAGHDKTELPKYFLGDIFDDLFIEVDPFKRSGHDCNPLTCDHYIGTLSITETVNTPTAYQIGLRNSACRVEVNVKDELGVFDAEGSEPKICLRGSMTQMNLRKEGIGEKAKVHTVLIVDPEDKTSYSTGRFGIMPSSEEQTVSVDILNGDTKLVTLNVPRSNLPQGATAGGLIIFDYVLEALEFYITIGEFTEKIIITNM